MKRAGLISEKFLLSAGILLLLLNLAALLIRRASAMPSKVAAEEAASSPDPETAVQLFKAGALTPELRWDDDLSLLDSAGNPVRFDDLLKDGRKLVFRFSELNCNECVNNELLILKQFAAAADRPKIIILASYKINRDFLVFKRINKIDFAIYNAPESVFNTQNVDSPFFFLADRKLQGLFPYIPDKEKVWLSEAYLRFIKNYW